jgi:hypothetical protein
MLTPTLLTAIVQVKVGLEEVAADLFRVKPYVYSAPDHSAVIVFSGVLARQAGNHDHSDHSTP